VRSTSRAGALKQLKPYKPVPYVPSPWTRLARSSGQPLLAPDLLFIGGEASCAISPKNVKVTRKGALLAPPSPDASEVRAEPLITLLAYMSPVRTSSDGCSLSNILSITAAHAALGTNASETCRSLQACRVQSPDIVYGSTKAGSTPTNFDLRSLASSLQETWQSDFVAVTLRLTYLLSGSTCFVSGATPLQTVSCLS
jgi:hypothetical protein